MFTRLYTQFQPSNYDITLDIDRDSHTFKGLVSITGVLVLDSSAILLHSKWLDISEAKIDGNPVAFSAGEFDELSLRGEQSFAQGGHVIEITYIGKIQTESMHGMYVSRFEHDGKQKQIIATQFESHHAREVIPCIDEPEAKATFNLAVHTPVNEAVLSNTLPKDQSQVDEKLCTVFETTPIMSTYLLALAFGEMHSVEAKTKNGTLLRNWSSVAQQKSHLEYSLSEGIKILEFYEDYFKTPFPLKKCDQIALPDFDAGAMENWGMVTYREIALLADPKNRSVSNEQYVSLVVAHELSHQWFGNLVTMKWWDDLWLNESFASIMEHLCLNELHPDWHQWEEYTASDVIATSNRDIFSDVQAVRVPVDNPELIETLFDPAIVYAKGGRLIKMLREYISDEAFRAGLQEYFTTHAYKNTSSDDLWNSLSTASGKNIGVLMQSWLNSSGMPVLSVDQSGSSLKLSQHRFVLDTENDSTQWQIPLLASSELPSDILDEKETQLTLKSNEYVYLNQYGSGHYLVNYLNQEHKNALAEAVRTNAIPNEGKIALLNDQLLLAKRGDVSLVEVLKLARSNQHENRESVWSLMCSVYGVARNLTEGNEIVKSHLKNETAQMIQPHYERLGWERSASEDPNDSHLRITAIALTLGAKHPDALKYALEQYDKHSADIEELPADLRSVILRTAVRHHPDHNVVISNLLDQYESSSSADVQLDICSALAQTREAGDVSIYEKRAFGESGFVRTQDFMRWIALLAGNTRTRDELWNYFENNWIYVKKSLNGSKSYDYFPIYVARGLNTNPQQKRYDDFFEPKKNEAILKRNILVAQNDIASRIAWRERDEQTITDYILNST